MLLLKIWPTDLPLARQRGRSAAERFPFLCGQRNSPDARLIVLRHEKAPAPFVYSACRHRDRVFRPAIIVAEFAVADVAQDRSLIQSRPCGDLCRLKQLLDGRQREYDVEQLSPRFVREKAFQLLSSLS